MIESDPESLPTPSEKLWLITPLPEAVVGGLQGAWRRIGKALEFAGVETIPVFEGYPHLKLAELGLAPEHVDGAHLAVRELIHLLAEGAPSGALWSLRPLCGVPNPRAPKALSWELFGERRSLRSLKLAMDTVFSEVQKPLPVGLTLARLKGPAFRLSKAAQVAQTALGKTTLDFLPERLEILQGPVHPQTGPKILLSVPYPS
jgi:hypothetical protein